MLGEPRSELGDPGDGGGVERGQLFLLAACGDELAVAALGLEVPLHVRAEVRLHLEQLAEILVEGVQQMIGVRVAQHDHSDLERYGLRLQRGGRDQAGVLDDLLQPHRPSPQRVLQRDPGDRVPQHVARFEDQVAAVRLVDRAGRDLAEVGDHGAELDPVLDPSDEVVVGRVFLMDDRRAAVRLVADDHIDPIARQRVFIGGQHLGARLRFVAAAGELAGVLDDLLRQPVQVRRHRGHRFPVRLQLFDPVLDLGLGHHLLELEDQALHVTFRLPYPPLDLGERLLHLAAPLQDLLLLLLR